MSQSSPAVASPSALEGGRPDGGEGGSVAGMAAFFTVQLIRRATTYPLQRFGQLTAAHHELVRQGVLHDPYEGLRDTVVTTIRTEGWLSGLYRGFLFDVITAGPASVINDVCAQLIQLNLYSLLEPFQDRLTHTMMLNISLGALWMGSVLSNVLLNPREVIQTAYATAVKVDAEDGEEDQGNQEVDDRPSSIAEVCRSVVRQNGWRTLYSGFLINSFASVGSRFAYFNLVNLWTCVLSEDRATQLLVPISITSSFLSIFVSQPLEVIRRRIMVAAIQGDPYSGPWQCANDIIRTEGWKGLFAGLKYRLVLATMNIGVSMFLA